MSIFEELPAPSPVPLTADQIYRKRRRFAVVLNWFAFGYGVVHKLAMPVFVTLFSTAHPPLRIDWSWTYHAVMAYLLSRKVWDDLFLRLAVTFGIGGLVCQVISSFLQYSWHTVSLWVTSGTTLALLLYLISIARWRAPLTYRIPRYTLSAAIGFIFHFAALGFSFHDVGIPVTGAARTQDIRRYEKLVTTDVCGVLGFSLSAQEGVLQIPSLKSVSSIDVKECGFSPILGLFDPSKPLVIRNEASGYLNVKAYRLVDGRWVGFENMPLLTGTTHEISAEALNDIPLILLASDADPKKGILVLVRGEDALRGLSGNPSTGLQVDRRGIRKDSF